MAELTCSLCMWFFGDVNSYYCCNSDQNSVCSLSVISYHLWEVNTKGNLGHVRGREVPTLNGYLGWCKINVVKNGLAKACQTLLHCVLRLCCSGYVLFCWETTNRKTCQRLNYAFAAKIAKFDARQFFLLYAICIEMSLFCVAVTAKSHLLVRFQSLLLLCIYCTPRGWPSVDIQR